MSFIVIVRAMTQTNKSVLLWTAVLVGIGLVLWGMIWLIKQTPATVQTLKQSSVSSTDWATGNPQSKTVLIEYGDFQCPACGQYYPIVEQVISRNQDKLLFVFRNFPLTQHPNARPAAYAAGAAGAQGKFFELYRLLYTRQNDWATKSAAEANALFRTFAVSLNLDMSKYDLAVNSAAVKNKVDQDYQGGVDSAINETPSFFLNGKRVKPVTVDDFQKLVDEATK